MLSILAILFGKKKIIVVDGNDNEMENKTDKDLDDQRDDGSEKDSEESSDDTSFTSADSV
ncbi:hypothetical protein ElyMa_000294800 [Elysia marginata]|uniref:Translocon-associated protein subunit alpha n=1 Tax=Elysia marginata TaxID=1093978 RepID=A0AAV4F7D7_9GAST|nr:hypothetical protein ElyMa_000294800 [Elysia marginata]